MDNALGSNLGRSGLILGLSLALGVLFDYFFWDKFPIGIGFTAYAFLITAAFFAISHYMNKRVRGDLLWLFPLLIFFSATVAVRSSLLLSVLDALGCIALLLLIMEVSVSGSLRRFIPTDYLKLFLPFRVVDPLIQTCADVLSMRKHVTDQKKAKQITRGILITLPIIIVFGLLFSSADPVFGKYVSRLTSWNFDELDVFRLIIVAGVTVVLTSFLSYALTGAPEAQSAESMQKRPIGHIELSILLGSVNALFLAFILIQITYLFGGESNITSQGFTYAEYARRGFWELSAVAALSYLILVIAERFIEKTTEHHSRTFKVLSSLVILQVGIIMTSAFYRMWLYEEAFGFTTLRVYVHAFIVLLGFVFACLLYKINIENKDNTFAFRTFLAIIVFMVGMNFFNPDSFIAQKNLQRYAETGNLDTEYLAVLSSDATPVLLNGLNSITGKTQHELGHIFYQRLHDYKTPQWVTWNWSRNNEHELLVQHSAELEKYAAPAALVYPADVNSSVDTSTNEN